MPDINQLKNTINTKTLHLVLLTIATAGIYPILWMHKNTPIIESITKQKIVDNTFIIWIAVCAGLSGAILGSGEEFLDIISGILSIAVGVLYIVWAFKSRTAIQEHALSEHKLDFRMNGFYTFFLNIYYINYCINDLEQAKRKHGILNDLQPSEAQ